LEQVDLEKSGYVSSFRDRTTADKLQRLIQLCLFIYAIFTVIRWTFVAMAGRLIRARLKRGIKNFKCDASNAQFEDLIESHEILERITLGEKTKGRGISDIRLLEMHRQRRLRLVRNFERNEKKKQIKSSKTTVMTSSKTLRMNVPFSSKNINKHTQELQANKKSLAMPPSRI
jgi:hypothetical protein